MRWEQIWKFSTARFSVVLECAPEEDPDVSWADAETLERLENGTYVNVTFRVRLLWDGNEIAADYLGNSVYTNVRDFYTEHLGLGALRRVDGCNYGCYFSDMVANVIREARERMTDVPRLRRA